MAGFLPPVVLELKAKADELFATFDEVKVSASKMADETTSSAQKMSSSFSKHSGMIAVAGAGLVAAMAGVAVEAAMSAEAVDSQLDVAIKNAGGSMEELQPQITGVDEKMRKLGFSNEDTNTSLSSLTVALNDPEKAMNAMGIAADLARTKNIPLAQASILVAKAMEGQTRPLKSLGIDLPIHAANALQVEKANTKLTAAQTAVNDILAKFPNAANPASKAHAKFEKATAAVQAAQEGLTIAQNAGDEIMKDLTARIGGTAEAFGDTLKGKMEETKATMSDLTEKIGNFLVPILKVLVDVGATVLDWAEKNPVIFNTIIGVIGFLVVALTALSVATWVQSIATTGLDGALSPLLVPILLIVAGIALLIAATVLLVQNWDTVMKFLGDTFTNIANFFVTVGGSIAKWWTDLWGGISSFAVTTLTNFTNNVSHTFTELISFFVTVGNAISAWWTGLWSGISSFAVTTLTNFTNNVSHTFTELISFFVTVGNAITGWWTGLWAGVFGFFSDAWNGYVELLSRGFTAEYDFMVGVGKNLSSWWWGLWTGMIGFFTNIFGGIGDFVGGIFNGVRNTIVDALNFLSSPINAVIDGINTVLDGMKVVTGGAISLHIPDMGAIPHFDVGGTIPGASGAPLLMVGHGGEEVLSRDMLAGTQPISQRAMDAMNAQSSTTGGPTVNVYAQTNASPVQIAATVGWQLRMMG